MRIYTRSNLSQLGIGGRKDVLYIFKRATNTNRIQGLSPAELEKEIHFLKIYGIMYEKISYFIPCLEWNILCVF
jgi:hypothetical protein